MLTLSVIGNLSRDPNIIEGQKWPLTEFSLAANTRRKGKDGKPTTEYMKVSVIGAQAKYAAGLKKGDAVYVAGDVSTYSYIGKDGEPHTIMNLFSNNIQALSRGAAPEAQESNATDDELPF